VRDDQIGLRGQGQLETRYKDYGEAIMKEVEDYIGKAATSDYYASSRERFATMVCCAKRHLPPGATVLDIGNSPGFLGYAFFKAGFEVSGLNLSDAWLDAYPKPEMAAIFSVVSCDIESSALPFSNGAFDAILFTEVLEHIAIKNPRDILPELRRVLKPGGIILFSTPNVCNLSNVVALLTGVNIFWPVNMFYGSTDRHNREFSPNEVLSLFTESGFSALEFFGINDHANWRSGTQDLIYPYLATRKADHALLRNTIIGVFAAVP